MAAKKGGLGKGLDSLIVKKEEGVVAVNPEQHGAPVEVDINKVEPNKLQPRKNFDEDKLQELADNIKIHGIVNPIIVQDRKGYYEIIGGERKSHREHDNTQDNSLRGSSHPSKQIWNKEGQHRNSDDKQGGVSGQPLT